MKRKRSVTFGKRVKKRLEKMILLEEIRPGVFRVNLHTSGMTLEMATYSQDTADSRSNAKGAAESARLYFIQQITDGLLEE